MKQPASGVQSKMQVLYDRYFASDQYRQRYPQPNQSSLGCIKRHLVSSDVSLLDVGCGNGRYLIPLLQLQGLQWQQVVACDISSSALHELQKNLGHSPEKIPIELILGSVDALPEGLRFDVALLMFGVLSHVGNRTDRQTFLKGLRHLAGENARLVLSVPNRWRRRPIELLGSMLKPQSKTDRADIEFGRRIDGQVQYFFYHLYTIRELRLELAQAGWKLVKLEPESLLPEWLITQNQWLAGWDGWLCQWLPASWGYGIRAVATAMATTE